MSLFPLAVAGDLELDADGQVARWRMDAEGVWNAERLGDVMSAEASGCEVELGQLREAWRSAEPAGAIVRERWEEYWASR